MSFGLESHMKGLSENHSSDDKAKDGKISHLYDLVCVGFGTTALALAVSLAESKVGAKVLFIEREASFHWAPQHILPDNQVGSSFLRDLIATQNPRSKFTLVSYLHDTDQLIRFTNNSRIVPSRRLMGQYFQWAASKFEQLGWVSYGQEALHVRPVYGDTGSYIAEWSMDVSNVETGAISSILAKRVVFATGAAPFIPQSLLGAPLVMHSSQSGQLLKRLSSAKKSQSIAIVGADQEAVELFEHLHTCRGKHLATLLFPESALRPKDDTPKVQDVLSRSTSMPVILPPEVRQRWQKTNSHSPTASLGSIESLYEMQYTQKLAEPDSSKWKFKIRALSEVVAVERKAEQVQLVIKNPRTGEVEITNQSFDVVIAATGYKFVINRTLIGVPSAFIATSTITVDSSYHVNFKKDALAPDCNMWLLGSLDSRQGRTDDFSLMAEKAQRAARSISKELKKISEKSRSQQKHMEKTML